jgi:hypothetical protein
VLQHTPLHGTWELLCVYPAFQGNYVDFNKNLLPNSLWFKNNASMQTIFELRLSGNKITHYKVETEFTQAFSFDFDLAARILEINTVDIKNEFKKESETKRVFEVEFPE